jgi:hypothetical protein
MGLLARVLGLSGPTHGRPPCSSLPSLGDMVPMVPNLIITLHGLIVTSDSNIHLPFSITSDTSM